jgi:hypothetical protein
MVFIFALGVLVFHLINKMFKHGGFPLGNCILLFGLRGPWTHIGGLFGYVMCYMCEDSDSCKHQHRNILHMHLLATSYQVLNLLHNNHLHSLLACVSLVPTCLR